VAEASVRGIALHPPKIITTWIQHAQQATVHGAVQNLQAWLRVARQNPQQGGGAPLRLEMPEFASSPANAAVIDDLALAVSMFHTCERATAVCGGALLCRRLCYANLYRLNERARQQSGQGWGSRNQLFRLCYPEYAPSDGDLTNLKGEARTALTRLSRDLHFGQVICRFAARGPCPEAMLLLQPTIPDRFLRKLTAPQLDLWADLVYHRENSTSHIFRCLWRATAMIVNQTVDLHSYHFPLEHVRAEGSYYVDTATNRPCHPSIEDLLTPIPLGSPWHLPLATNGSCPALIERLSIPLASDEERPTQSMHAADEGGRLDTDQPSAESPALSLHRSPWCSTEKAATTSDIDDQAMVNLDAPSFAFGCADIWAEHDQFQQDLRELGYDITTAGF
jgi:hypothetical protein